MAEYYVVNIQYTLPDGKAHTQRIFGQSSVHDHSKANKLSVQGQAYFKGLGYEDAQASSYQKKGSNPGGIEFKWKGTGQNAYWEYYG